MDPETKRTLITCGTSILCIIISNIFIYLSSKTNEKKNKNTSIIEQQYNKLFTPIHRIIFFTNLEDSDKITRIYNVIYSNYNLSTDVLREEFNDCLSNGKITKQFKETIKGGCKCLENALGYTSIKLNQQQKEMAKTVIYSENRSSSVITNLKLYSRNLSIVLFIITVLIIIVKLLVEYNIVSISDSIHIFVNIYLILFLILFLLSTFTFIILEVFTKIINAIKKFKI